MTDTSRKNVAPSARRITTIPTVVTTVTDAHANSATPMSCSMTCRLRLRVNRSWVALDATRASSPTALEVDRGPEHAVGIRRGRRRPSEAGSATLNSR